jgi:non-homologous end joining protein Ku
MIFFNKQELDPLFIEKSYYITPGSIDEKGKKEKPSSSTIIIQDKCGKRSSTIHILDSIGY